MSEPILPAPRLGGRGQANARGGPPGCRPPPAAHNRYTVHLPRQALAYRRRAISAAPSAGPSNRPSCAGRQRACLRRAPSLHARPRPATAHLGLVGPSATTGSPGVAPLGANVVRDAAYTPLTWAFVRFTRSRSPESVFRSWFSSSSRVRLHRVNPGEDMRRGCPEHPDMAQVIMVLSERCVTRSLYGLDHREHIRKFSGGQRRAAAACSSWTATRKLRSSAASTQAVSPTGSLSVPLPLSDADGARTDHRPGQAPQP
jgi:hypothetical protein